MGNDRQDKIKNICGIIILSRLTGFSKIRDLEELRALRGGEIEAIRVPEEWKSFGHVHPGVDPRTDLA